MEVRLKNIRQHHPFGFCIPKNVKYLWLGTFPGKDPGEWFYGTKRTQFWKILEEVYKRDLSNLKDKRCLFEEMGLGVGDILKSAIRSEDTNADENLVDVEINFEEINKILENKNIKTIFFSSQNAFKLFKKYFKTDKPTIVLPSPSPRYARMSLEQKIVKYRELLPKI